ncbi:hypothetical protein VNI00_015833 [Paramarasmius palmivorus]|uniref:Uncharacterized protein n=1 Tax=Paramarasmius palmivorus TaxID=297713 RepID=A0AAW0BIA9_9AGAR
MAFLIFYLCAFVRGLRLDDVNPKMITPTNDIMVFTVDFFRKTEEPEFRLLLSPRDGHKDILGNVTLSDNVTSPVIVGFQGSSELSGEAVLQADAIGVEEAWQFKTRIQFLSEGQTTIPTSSTSAISPPSTTDPTTSPDSSSATVTPTNTSQRETTATDSATISSESKPVSPSSNGPQTSGLSLPQVPNNSVTESASLGKPSDESQTNETTSSRRPSASTLGGAISGSLIALLLVVSVLFWYCRRRRSTRDPNRDLFAYMEPLDLSLKRRHKARGSGAPVSRQEIPTEQSSERQVQDETRQRREPRFVIHDDSGWRPNAGLSTPSETGSTLVIDLPPRYDAAL